MHQSSDNNKSIWIIIGIIIIIFFAVWQFKKGDDDTTIASITSTPITNTIAPQPTPSYLPTAKSKTINLTKMPPSHPHITKSKTISHTKTTQSNSSTTKPKTTNPTKTIASKIKYANGTYSATGYYFEPAGQEQVNVSVTLKNDIVTTSTFTGIPSNFTAQRIMMQFQSGFKNYVVGKPIDQISLGVVNCSSLTPMGFMNALQKIKTQAAQA